MTLSPDTPFDKVVAHINASGYHNQRQQIHSDLVSEGIHADLLKSCEKFRQDHDRAVVKKWINVKTPGDRERNIDLFVGEPDPADLEKPNLGLVRFCVENKSVITAHRNRTNRFDDLDKIMGSLHAVRSQAVIVATVLIGVSSRYLNVADEIRGRVPNFERKVFPRLSTGDEKLFKDFPFAVSKNGPRDAERTLAKLRQLSVRDPGMTHERGFDFLLLVPVHIDNVHPASIARDNPYGIDFDKDYALMLKTICAAYRARWHTMAS